jgi:mRNA interferase HigB
MYVLNPVIMKIIGRSKLTEFSRIHPETANPLLRWLRIVGVEADWKNIHHVKETFRSVDFVKPNNFVFNIKGNKIRLIATIDFIGEPVFAKWD